MKKGKIIALVGFLLGIFISFFLGYYIGKTPILSDEVSREQIQREFLNDLRQAGILKPLPSELKNIAGNLIKVEKNFVVINPKEDRNINPLGATFPKEMKFLIDSDTKFSLAHEKNQEEFIKEYEEYQKELEKRDKEGESTENLIMPQPFSYEIIGVGALKIGDSVNIVCDVNVLKDESDFYAKEISVMNEIEKFLRQ
jgi:ABC-type antimicrobial peptide transport system permease subunit